MSVFLLEVVGWRNWTETGREAHGILSRNSKCVCLIRKFSAWEWN